MGLIREHPYSMSAKELDGWGQKKSKNAGFGNIALVMVTNDNNLKRPLRLDEPSVGHIRLFDGDSDSRIVT